MAHPRIARLALVALLLGACEQGPVRHWEILPGAEPLPEATQAALDEAWRHRDPAGKPRTRHLREDGTPRYTNRLFLESSPYLRQHAHNPVNWYPWGDEAFETARRLGRPVLLSVGYSTCHWCHVMEEESFEDEEIARFLNEHYVAVKVDREQRPDVDSIYMTAVQAISGRGGWPMTVWLTADREPFYAGTYFPPRDGDRRGRTGFLTLLETVADSYREDSTRLEARASDLAAKIRSILESPSPAGKSPAALPGADVLWGALEAARRRFDPVHGGPRGAPKFPSTLPVRALLRHHRRSGNEEALHMAVRSLDGMAAGGIHDHLAGGFHRYSVDAEWRVPHFEKMLYDNALLTMAYVEAWQVTGRQDLADVARGILAWTEREMTAPDGGFYSATDADSADPHGEMVEGWYFTWTPRETEALLGADAAALFNMAYGVEAPGNLDGRSVLHAAASADEVAEAFHLDRDQVRRSLATSGQTLRKAREQRPGPLRDDKILTAWNGLMISAAARASLALDDDRYRAMAARAADFLLRDFARSGRLARSTLGDRRQSEAFLDDYAALAAGLLDLYEAGDGDRRLEQAMALDEVLAEHFEDPAGGFFLTSDDHDDLLVREKPLSDGSEPSGNSLAILNLLRLAEITADKNYLRRADRALAALSDLLRRHPLGASEALLAVDFADDAAKEIVLVTATDRASLRPLLSVLGPAFVPNRVLLTATDDSPRTRALPLLEGKVAIDGRPTAYVCENNVCDLPTGDPEVLARQIRRVEKIAPAP